MCHGAISIARQLAVDMDVDVDIVVVVVVVVVGPSSKPTSILNNAPIAFKEHLQVYSTSWLL